MLSPGENLHAESVPHNVARTAKLICNVNVSVVIPCLNEQAHIAAAIQSAWAAGVLEVIVVDGGSNDDTPRIASENSAQVVSCIPGRAVQMNAGAAIAWGNVLLFFARRLPIARRCPSANRRCVFQARTNLGGFSPTDRRTRFDLSRDRVG